MKMKLIAATTAFSIWMVGCSRTPNADVVEAHAREAAAFNAATQTPSQTPSDVSQTPNMVEIPSGTSISIRLNQSLSTATNRRGETFSATLATPVVVDGQTVIPTGAEVKGVVLESVPSGRLKGRAVLSLPWPCKTSKRLAVNIKSPRLLVQA